MRKKLLPQERAVFNVVTLYRERGNYLLRLEQFHNAIYAYNEALRWNNDDVQSLLGRSLARSKATQYAGALADAVRAAELEPNNYSAMQIRAKTEYEKCAFEKALVLAHIGERVRKTPPDFAECRKYAEETIRECTDKSASKVLKSAQPFSRTPELDDETLGVTTRISRMQPQQTHQVQEMSRVQRQKSEQTSRLMASKYLESMAHDKYFLTSLCKDERLNSANKQGSQKLQELALTAFADIEKRQDVLRERRPLYAARALEAKARARLTGKRNEKFVKAQNQNVVDAKRLIKVTNKIYEEHDTTKCIESAEFAMEQIAKKPQKLLPGKDKFLQELYDIVANAFLDQKQVRGEMSESDREKRAFVLLGMCVSREPSHDSMLKTRPAPPRDIKHRQRLLEKQLALNLRTSERCYLLHELARLYVDTKQPLKAKFHINKCQTEARASGHRVWLINILFLLARCNVLQNNRPEARAALLEAASVAKLSGYNDVVSFLETCSNVSTEGEIESTEEMLEQRERAMVSIMQDDDLKQAAEQLFRRMSTIPAARRFSVMPGAKVGDDDIPTPGNRRASIMPKTQQPVIFSRKTNKTLGFVDFDI